MNERVDAVHEIVRFAAVSGQNVSPPRGKPAVAILLPTP